MPELGSGVLLKLFEDTYSDDDDDEDGSEEAHDVPQEPVLLQIRSIIPVLTEGDFWPNKGFYLKVSDNSHTLFVSLPQIDDEMILGNKLQLGQYIYIDRLEAAFPVPMLKGVRPVPGRRPCTGNPKELNSLRHPDASDIESAVEDSNDMKKRPRERYGASRDKHSIPRKVDAEKEVAHVLKGLRKIYSCFADRNQKGSDSDSSAMSNSPKKVTPKRRIWDAKETSISVVGELFVVKDDLKHNRSSTSSMDTKQTSSQHSTSYDGSDEDSSAMRRRREVDKSTKLAHSFNRSRSCISVKSSEKDSPVPVNKEHLIDTEIQWFALPSNLSKLGKKVLAQRNAALQAAVEALQDASASQRVLKCLSTYSKHQFGKEEDQQPTVYEFLDLQDDLALTTLILEQMTNPSPLRAPASDSEAEKVASDRNKNATLWVKSAVESDLSTKMLSIASAEPIPTSKRTRTVWGSKPKNPFGTKKLRRNDEAQIGSIDKSENQPWWAKRSDQASASNLVKSLQTESRRQFLVILEEYLDEASKSISLRSDGEVMEMMGQVKRVNSWLDVTVTQNANSSKTGLALDESESEAYRRVSDKIYEILLKHVERSTIGVASL